MFVLFNLAISLMVQVGGWETFADTTFDWVWSDEYESHIEIPTFSKRVRSLDGSEITLTGHYIPMELDGNRVIISKQPFADCFFCGGAGPESVAEVVFKSPQKVFKPDELLTVKGRLKLNKYDYEHMVFIIENATIINL